MAFFRRAQHRLHPVLAAAAATCGSLVAVRERQGRVAWCEEETQLSWTERIKGNYNNRIRDLSTPEKIFLTFAKEQKEGEKMMTADDFVEAILPFDWRSSAAHHKMSRVPEVFLLADADGDGLISYKEFVFFSTLLSIPEHKLEIAFRMFDLNGNGDVDFEEFAALMEVMRPSSLTADTFGQAVEGSPILERFFGKDRQGKLSLQQFESFQRELKQAVLRVEFERYDVARKGSISARSFGMCLVGYAHANEVQAYITRVNALGEDERSITFEQFQDVEKVLANLDEVALAINLYSQSKEGISKNDFGRAVTAVSSIHLPQVIIDTIFALFDADQNGMLDAEELLDVMRKRSAHAMGHSRTLGVWDFFRCCTTCSRTNLGKGS